MKQKIKWLITLIILCFMCGANLNAASYEMIQENEVKCGDLMNLNDDYAYAFHIESDTKVLFQLELSNGGWEIYISNLDKGNTIYHSNINVQSNMGTTEYEIDENINSGNYVITIISKNLFSSYSLKYHTYLKGFFGEGQHLSYFDKDGQAYGLKYINELGYPSGYYYFDQNGYAVDGFYDINGKTYYFDQYVKLESNGLKEIDGQMYCFYDSALLDDGWQTMDGETFYIMQSHPVNGFQQIDGNLYYFDNYKLVYFNEVFFDSSYFVDGKAVNGFQYINDQLYYFDNYKMKTGLVELDGDLYCFNPNAQVGFRHEYLFGNDYKAVKDGFVSLDDSLYYVINYEYQNEGWKKIDNETYYFPKDFGYSAVNGWQILDNKTYYFDNFKMSKGIKYIDGKGHSFNNHGVYQGLANGWNKKVNGEWEYYINGILLNGWQSIDGLQYYFRNYEMVHDWFLDEKTKTWYFFSGGVMQRSNLTINDVTYKFDTDGIWRGYDPRWVWYNENYYYRDEWNNDVTGWQSIDGLQYMFTEEGIMVRDWYLDEKTQTWYFFNGGVMQRSNLTFNGITYKFDTNGIWRGYVPRWVTIGNNVYYCDEWNNHVVGHQTIDGKKYYFNQSGILVTSESTGWQIIGNEKYFFNNEGEIVGDGPVKKVIDISEHNGDINWDAVKKDGIDGVILRIGYGYSSEDPYYQIDKAFIKNYNECRKRNIPIGIYLYSYSDNIIDSIGEAQRVIDLLADLNITPSDLSLPVFYDLEEFHDNTLPITEMADRFCKIIEKNGFQAGIYASTSYYNDYLDFNTIKNYYIWVAHYAEKCTYKNPYQMWQYTSKGIINGVKGNVDINIMF